MRSSKYTEHYTDTFITFKEIMRTVSNIYHNCVPDKIKNRRNTDQLKQRDTVIIACVIWGIINGYTGMATVFLTNFIRCRTSFRMLFRLSLTMSLLGCDDLRQELTVKVRLPRQRQHIRAHYQGFAAPISGYGNQPVSRSQVYRATEGGSTN